MKSRLIRFVDSAHTLLRTEQINHGHVMTCYIQLYIASDLATGKVVSGLYLADTQGHEAYVDADELPLLLAAMNRISKEILGSPPVNRAAVYFRSRGGFEAGCLEDEKSQWQLFIQLNARDAASLIKIKKSDFEVFVQILTDVQGKL
jgi:hypothetical protein